MKFKRIFLIILDSVGVGEAIDANQYGDTGANTLGNIMKNYDLFVPNLKKIGFLNTLSMNNLESDAYYTIARPKNTGKDCLSGHYEMMGIRGSNLKTYKETGFSRELLEEIVKKTGKGIIGNIVGNHESVIDKLIDRHLETGSLIVYTVGESDLEIAASEDVMSVSELHKCAEIIREITANEPWKVGEVIARSFKKENGKLIFNNVKHYVLNPPNRSVLSTLKDNGIQVISIGKISDIYNEDGITKIIKADDNFEGLNKLSDIMEKNFEGLCILNLNDFDELYGHKRDLEGYAKALESIDVEIPLILNKLDIEDLLIITADHGCDPTIAGISHTRENLPVIIYSRCFKDPKQLDILDTLSDIGATILENFVSDQKPEMGSSFLDKLK